MKMINAPTVLQKAQDFAIGQVLSEWDSTFDYDDIIATLRSDAFADGEDWAVDQVTPWEAYENDSGSDVAQTMENMVFELVRLFGDTK
jgi:hypothetical protein